MIAPELDLGSAGQILEHPARLVAAAGAAQLARDPDLQPEIEITAAVLAGHGEGAVEVALGGGVIAPEPRLVAEVEQGGRQPRRVGTKRALERRQGGLPDRARRREL